MRSTVSNSWHARLTFFLAIVALSLAALFTSPATADESETTIPNFDVSAHLDRDGTLSVRFVVTAEFSDDVHGLFFVLPTAQPYDDDGNYQLYRVDFGDATMDGSPVPTRELVEGDTTTLRVGDPDSYVTGRHEYSVEFMVNGIVRPNDVDEERDILPWDIITAGAYQGWNIENFSLDLTAPDGAAFTCTAGDEGSTTPCRGITQIDGEYSARVSDLGDGGVTAKLTWDSGTINAPEPRIVYREPAAQKYGFQWPALAAGLVLIGGAMACALRIARKDERYVGLPPGTHPDSRRSSDIELNSKHPVVVRFDPPQMEAAQAGVALTKKADDGEVLATVIISLAQRGYLQIIEYEDPLGKKRDAPDPINWMLYVLREPDELLTSWEAEFLTAISDPATGEDRGMKKKENLDEAAWRSTLSEAGLKVPERPGTRLRQLNDGVAQRLIADATGDASARWVLPAGRSRAGERVRYIATAGVGVGAILVAAGFIGEFPIVGYGVGVLLASVLLRLACIKTTAFSAEGSVAHEQARGFQLYLKKAEIGQLREAERAQLFINTLPWAISLGVVGHWSSIADEVLAVREDVVWAPFWWSAAYGYMLPGHVSDSVGSFSEAAGAAAHMKGAEKAYEAAASTVSSSSAGSSGSVGGGSFGSGGGTW